jgi:CheY-like chemotaxis protein
VSKVLIVEDSPTTRAVIKVYLVGQYYEFIEATAGDQGLALAKQHRPDVIVVDLKMPGLDGFSLCRAVRADPRLRNTPVILLTSSKGEVVEREAKLAGITHFMNKPIDAALLAKLIQACLEGKTG